ncbi:NRDE family protein [Komagataeibacter rhaeticus]|nr:NRDE family protein [Komagataeibacter rhaeticus]
MAANRDERLDRPWLPPGRHWPDHPGIVGGQDQVAGGSWLTLNDAGVVAGIMNRVGSLGPMPGKNSRGALPLLAGRFDTARAAVEHIATIDAGAWRSFNMIVADRLDAFFIRGPGYGQPQVEALAPGVHMVATTDPDDMAMPRIHRHLPRFRAALRRCRRTGRRGPACWPTAPCPRAARSTSRRARALARAVHRPSGWRRITGTHGFAAGARTGWATSRLIWRRAGRGHR